MKEKEGVAGVIEALLLVGLVSIILSTIQLVYIPQIMEDREAEHMDEVSNQFSSLKSMIDLQIITRSHAPIFSMITLGSRELPYFITARAYGEVSIPEETGRIVVDEDEWNAIPLTCVKYVSYNAYFVDQTYVLEGGSIIVKQIDGEPVMRVEPSITVENSSKVNIYFDLPVIKGVAGKNFTYGHGKCFIRTNFSNEITYQNWTSISSNVKIYSNYAQAWYNALENIMGDLVKIELNGDHIEIKRKNKDIGFYVTEFPIYMQIGPGWIR
jgi:hypothetical protein